MKREMKLAACAIGAVMSFFAFFGTAQAATLSNCQPSLVDLDFHGAPNSSRLRIFCTADNTSYYTNPNSSCPAASVDMVKMWESIATSALMSGKKLNITYTSCGVDRAIDSLGIGN